MSKDTETDATDEAGDPKPDEGVVELDDVGRANQPGVEDERTRLLDEANEKAFGTRDFGQGGRGAVEGGRDTGEAQNVETGDAQDVEQFATGNGWYEIDGEKVRGADAAREQLAKRNR